VSKRVVFALLVLVACTRGTADGDGRVPEPAATASPSIGASARRSTYVRSCESRVYGALGPDWRRGQIVAGPVVLVGASGYAADAGAVFSAPGRLATSQKVLVVVRGSRPVEISVRHPDAALAYDPSRWSDRNVVPFRRGDRRVRFEPCGGDRRWTQFNGAFLLRGPGCVPVEVRPQDRAPVFVTISFGAGDRC
jgi:hypothetical protein